MQYLFAFDSRVLCSSFLHQIPGTNSNSQKQKSYLRRPRLFYAGQNSFGTAAVWRPIKYYFIPPSQLTIIAEQALQIKPDRSGSFLPNVNSILKKKFSAKTLAESRTVLTEKRRLCFPNYYNAFFLERDDIPTYLFP